jgi:large subunit ribosomal protein L10
VRLARTFLGQDFTRAGLASQPVPRDLFLEAEMVPMDRTQKADAVQSLHEAFRGAPFVAVAHYSGLTVAEIDQLRVKMLSIGATFKVAKNRLAKIALKGTPYEGLEALFNGPTGITFSTDAVGAAKITSEFAKANEKFVLLGGGMGSQVLTAQSIDTLAKLPSLDALRSQFLGLLMSPATRVASVIQAPAGGLARVIQAHADKQAA